MIATIRFCGSIAIALAALALSNISRGDGAETAPPVDASSLRGRVMCGYQGWFRCPGDAADMGWVHWSRDSRRIAPETLSFEMWPEMSEYSAAERFAAPGFTHADGSQAYLFSSDNARTVERHFEWMRDYGIDGVWLQHFLVDLPGGPAAGRYPSRRRTLDHVAAAAKATGRVWALTYDISGLKQDQIFDVLTGDWKKMVDEKIIAHPRYVHEGGRPVVQVWGFYPHERNIAMTAELADRLIDFFHAPGPYRAYLVGGGDWNWRQNSDPKWRAAYRRLDGYAPWNVGNASADREKVKHATTSYWAADKQDCDRRGALWMPVVYPGFSWDNLRRQPAGTSTIPRRGGAFYWEQFHELARLKAETVFVAMFDEVDEGTAIFKISNSPPTQAHFLGLEGLPSDWYLRLTGEGIQMLRGNRPITAEIPIKP